MLAKRQTNGARRGKALGATLAAAACLLGGTGQAATGAATGAAAHAASGAGAGATADLVRFAVDSPATIQAELIATKYWGTSPCGGTVGVSWAPLDATVNATSDWWNPVAAYGNAAANSQCTITFNQAQEFDWPMFCTVMVHEIGHLTGQQHSTDPASVMYPAYESPIPQCTGTPAGTAAAAPAVQATAVKRRAGRAHRAHSRHRAHRHGAAARRG